MRRPKDYLTAIYDGYLEVTISYHPESQEHYLTQLCSLSYDDWPSVPLHEHELNSCIKLLEEARTWIQEHRAERAK